MHSSQDLLKLYHETLEAALKEKGCSYSWEQCHRDYMLASTDCTSLRRACSTVRLSAMLDMRMLLGYGMKDLSPMEMERLKASGM